MQRQAASPISETAPAAHPTPIPILALLERPADWASLVAEAVEAASVALVEEAEVVADEVVSATEDVFDGCGLEVTKVDDVGSADEVTLEPALELDTMLEVLVALAGALLAWLDGWLDVPWEADVGATEEEDVGVAGNGAEVDTAAAGALVEASPALTAFEVVSISCLK